MQWRRQKNCYRPGEFLQAITIAGYRVFDLNLLVKGVLLGLGAAVPIGPVNVEIARRTIRGGFRHGFVVGCGAVTVDLFYTLVSVTGYQSILARPAVYRTAAVLGVLVLAYLGIMSWRSAWRGWRSAETDALALQAGGPAATTIGRDYLTGLLMTLANPMTLAFWFTVVPAVSGNVAEQGARDLPIICIGVFTGTTGWVVTFTGLLSGASRRGQDPERRRRWTSVADAVGGTVLIFFAAAAAWRALAEAFA